MLSFSQAFPHLQYVLFLELPSLGTLLWFGSWGQSSLESPPLGRTYLSWLPCGKPRRNPVRCHSCREAWVPGLGHWPWADGGGRAHWRSVLGHGPREWHSGPARACMYSWLSLVSDPSIRNLPIPWGCLLRNFREQWAAGIGHRLDILAMAISY